MFIKGLAIVVMVFSNCLFAEDLQQEISQFEAKEKKSQEWNYRLGVGYQSLFQRSATDAAYENSQTYPSLSAGVEFQMWSFVFEIGQYDNESSSGNLRISQERTVFDIWSNYRPKSWGSWSPILGVGLGVYTDEVTTRFGNREVSGVSEILSTLSAKAGFNWRFLDIMYTDLDIRLSKRETSPHVEWATHSSLGFRL